MIDLDAIEARANAATAGPWTHSRGIGKHMHDPEPADWINTGWYSACVEELETVDAAFCCAARTDVPALCAEIRRLREKYEPAPPKSKPCSFCGCLIFEPSNCCLSCSYGY